MTAAVLYGKENVLIEQVEVPVPGPGDLLVRVRVALTCGTDVKVFRRGYHARMIVPPALFGHELAGEVAAVGSQVLDFKVGDHVVAANSAPCGACFYCLHHQANLCEDLVFNNGAYAEYIRIPARIVSGNTYKLPPELGFADAALAEPLACALKGVRDAGVKAGDFVAVIGLGPLGTMIVRLASLAGARVIAIGRRAEQIDRALSQGAEFGISLEQCPDPVARVKQIAQGRGVDVAIEAVGKPECWQWAVQMLRRGGTVNFFGGCPSGTLVQLDTELLHYSNLTCVSSFHHTPALIQEALGIIAAGDVRASVFVNQEARLDQVPKVLANLARQNGNLKTAILP